MWVLAPMTHIAGGIFFEHQKHSDVIQRKSPPSSSVPNWGKGHPKITQICLTRPMQSMPTNLSSIWGQKTRFTGFWKTPLSPCSLPLGCPITSSPNSLWTQITTFTSTRIGTSVGMVGKTPKMGRGKKILGSDFGFVSFSKHLLAKLGRKPCLKTCTMKPQLATCFQQDKSANKSCYSSQGLALKNGHVFWMLQMLVGFFPLFTFCGLQFKEVLWKVFLLWVITQLLATVTQLWFSMIQSNEDVSFTLSHSKFNFLEHVVPPKKRHLENSQTLQFLRAQKSNHQKKPIPSLIASQKSMVIFFSGISFWGWGLFSGIKTKNCFPPGN